MKDIESLNLYLLNSCLELAKVSFHPEQKDRTIMQVFDEDECAILRPMVPLFDGYAERYCKVSSTCLIQFDRNRYSVECCYAHQTVSVRAYANKVVITAKNKVIGEHERQFGRDKTIFNPWHYVPLLERKPGALRNGAPFHEWELPSAIQKIREVLIAKRGGDKQIATILLAITQHGLEAVTVACELAITDKVMSAEYILNLLGRLHHTTTPTVIPTPDNLQLQIEPKSNCNRYDILLRGMNNHVIH
jgi:hypothetical protein